MLGSLSLATAWSGPLPVLSLAAAAVVPLAVCRAVVRLGVSPWASAAVLVSLLVLGAYVLAADAGTAFSDTVTDAVPRLLTTPRPLPARADVLVGPLLLTSLVSLLVAIRLTSHRLVAPVVGALALYVAGALLTTGEGDRRGLLASVLVACTLLGWVVLDEHRHRTGRRIALALVVALAATGLLVASTTVRWSAPFEPRTLVDPPTVDVVASNPLAQLGAWTSDPDRELLDVSGPVGPLRLVTLDRYDGAQWSAGTRYSPVGETYDVAPLLGSSTRSSTVRVEMVDIEERWLPSPGWPTEVSTDDAVVEPVSGNLWLTSSDGLVRSGTDAATTRGVAYTVTGLADDPDDARLASATVPTGGGLAPYLALPPLPQQLSTFAEQTVAGAVTPYDRAVAIETMLHDRARLSPTAVSGSQLWRITTFLLAEPGTVGARVGTAEQFATSFAVLARHNGLPTRVVVGFRPDPETRRSATDGWSVRGRHATAWPEVFFQDLGWVPFSPTDAREAPRPEEETVERGDGDDPGPGATPDDSGTGTGQADGTGQAAPSRPGGPGGWVVPAAAGAGGLAGLLALLLAARRIRSWRHLRRGPRGAWAEARDVLRLAGLPVTAHHSADDVATMASRRLGTDAVKVLAATSQRAAFAPPGTDADDPGPVLGDVRRAARRAVPRWRRWWWPFDPSVFLSRG
ncbi:transglutaminase domain-containing protein [Nocardioides sp. zg-1228]|uniref:DUF3488 and transglutaminase-like domain-containing protein n=1 Tax=Nocardioides sp. zg-1228 TaxID=2763008 RepID=UPI001642CE7D|nr:transglutaminase domain-containing protein [Nocardioides sp. zg-1228]MBC2933197.1 transglutaminase domain-containing protein [Nocardioides sp. zg-1228]QSF56630.1 transglutaminase domain-containing protein [Nocardioides sp. zg-1228]